MLEAPYRPKPAYHGDIWWITFAWATYSISTAQNKQCTSLLHWTFQKGFQWLKKHV